MVSSVRDKNNSHGDWREDIFITEETEIIGITEKSFCIILNLILYNFSPKVINNHIAAGDKSKNTISGVIMVIMIISFRGKKHNEISKS